MVAATVALLVAVGCEEEARVSFTVFSEPGRLDPGTVTVRFSDDGRTRTVSGDDFAGDGRRADTPEFGMGTRGTLDVEVEVETDAGRVASGILEIPLQPDWRWHVHLFLDERNPNETCIGCFGYRSFPVVETYRTSPAESLWMLWGGNSISSPVVY
ncbi:MAG TPA: hypothetical protein VEY33_10900 [Gemmatimonadota bacterium]|nr:hypothetical protein [Gemmatimonadota bacterium]